MELDAETYAILLGYGNELAGEDLPHMRHMTIHLVGHRDMAKSSTERSREWRAANSTRHAENKRRQFTALKADPERYGRVLAQQRARYAMRKKG